ncbi:MAG: hypothetical protein M5U22_20040 [Thermoleophilia bacterium]|nr:hypothetical protein [Thermoleophilia bacterium]
MLGPEGDRPWDARLLMEQPALRSYAGLWGRYSDDPLRGEDAPAGPRFDPDGSIRTSWYDPVGWARLTEVPPASQELGLIDEELARLDREQKTTVEAIARAEREAEKLGVQDAALRQAPTSPAQLEALEAQLRGPPSSFMICARSSVTCAAWPPVWSGGACASRPVTGATRALTCVTRPYLRSPATCVYSGWPRPGAP